jgi:hypothetical protein
MAFRFSGTVTIVTVALALFAAIVTFIAIIAITMTFACAARIFLGVITTKVSVYSAIMRVDHIIVMIFTFMIFHKRLLLFGLD